MQSNEKSSHSRRPRVYADWRLGAELFAHGFGVAEVAAALRCPVAKVQRNLRESRRFRRWIAEAEARAVPVSAIAGPGDAGTGDGGYKPIESVPLSRLVSRVPRLTNSRKSVLAAEADRRQQALFGWRLADLMPVPPDLPRWPGPGPVGGGRR